MAGILGALIGYWLAGFPGAIAGYLVLRLFGRGLEQNVRNSYDLHARGSDIFFTTVFSMLGHLAKADGRVSEDEIAHAEALMARLSIQGEKRDAAIASFKAGSAADFDLTELLQEFNGAARFRPDLKRNLFMFLVEMAMADDELHSAEEQVLRNVAAGLNIDARSFEQLLDMLKAQHSFAGSGAGASRHGADELARAYRALGVSEADSDREIKRAYRKLMSQYHPDKMIAKGVPEDMLAVATEKAQEVQAAYDVIEKARKASTNN